MYIQVTEEDEPRLNHSCYVQRDSSSDFDADTPAPEFFEQVYTDTHIHVYVYVYVYLYIYIYTCPHVYTYI